MAELKRGQPELAMAQAEISRIMADMDYSQVVLLRFHVQDKIRSPRQEKMSNLEVVMAKPRRVQSELETSQAQFMNEVQTPSQEKSTFENGVDELAIIMTELATCEDKLFMEKTRTNVQISHSTQGIERRNDSKSHFLYSN